VLPLGMGSRAISKRAYFAAAATHAVGSALVPVPGGILIRDAKDTCGLSGDTSDSDDTAGVIGIAAAELAADPG